MLINNKAGAVAVAVGGVVGGVAWSWGTQHPHPLRDALDRGRRTCDGGCARQKDRVLVLVSSGRQHQHTHTHTHKAHTHIHTHSLRTGAEAGSTVAGSTAAGSTVAGARAGPMCGMRVG